MSVSKWACTVRAVPEVKFPEMSGNNIWYSLWSRCMYISLISSQHVCDCFPNKHHQLVSSVRFVCIFQILGRLRCCFPGTCPAVSPWTVLWEPVGDGHGQAQETQADAVHLRGDRDVRKEGVVTAHEGTSALKVSDDVEDLLALRLPHHPPNVQQGGDVLLPVQRKDIRRRRREVDGCEWQLNIVWCHQAVMIVSQQWTVISLSHSIGYW